MNLKVLEKSFFLAILILFTNILYAQDCNFTGKKKISLVDVTFCANSLITTFPQDKLNDFKEEYKKYFGDVTVERTGNAETEVEWTTKRVEPTGSTVDDCKAEGQKAVTTLTCELATAKWKALSEVLEKICTGEANSTPDKLKEGSDTYFNNQEALAAKYNLLSIPDVKFTEFAAQSFLKLYRTFTKELSCEAFKSPKPYSEFWKIYGSPTGELTDAQRDAFSYSNYYFIFVTNIAYYHALGIIYNYAGLVNTAIGTFNEDQREALQVLLSQLNESTEGKLSDLQATQLNIAKSILAMHEAVNERVKNYKEPEYVKR